VTEADGQFDVVIVGAGPCGVTLANHLGLYGVRTLIVDRSAAILDYPRAVGMDDEALRSFQAVGLAEPLLADMIRNVPARYHTASGYCFAHVHPQEQPFGWSRRNLFIQPMAERTLRGGLARYPSVRLQLGASLLTLVAQGEGVLATFVRGDGSTYAVGCTYLVGADGGRSTVRDLINVRLEGKTDAARWLVVDMQNDDLDSPYSSVFTHRHHPRMSIALPYGHRRFEFRLPVEESDEEAVSPGRLEERLRLFYGTGPRRANVLRARVYRHHSRIAEQFQSGRVFLAGDAAHLQPPFFGQGMNSGLRDATNLGWKLAAVLRGLAAPRLLESYDAERHDHARKMVNVATMFGRLYAPGSRVLEIARDLFFWLAQRMPRLRDYVLQMKFKPMPRYDEGLVLPRTDTTKEGVVGRMFMQPIVETTERGQGKLDEALGPWFAVIGIGADPAGGMSEASRKFWADLGASLVMVQPSRSEVVPVCDGVAVIEDLMGAFRDWHRTRPMIRFIVLRPDRYVAAVAGINDLNSVTEQLQSLLEP
jgi:3-(3-hydroxy-phenyl)propionate hydroxylase